jgi:hypothetical protein
MNSNGGETTRNEASLILKKVFVMEARDPTEQSSAGEGGGSALELKNKEHELFARGEYDAATRRYTSVSLITKEDLKCSLLSL